MKLKIYQVDAFTSRLFSGNPAAVIPLDQWIEESLMQKIANENNLSETAFYVKRNNEYEIRWFTPSAEVDLCGHATLASAFVIFNVESISGDTINFISLHSEKLSVSKNGEWIDLTFPADEFQEVPMGGDLENCFNEKAVKVYKGKTDYMLVFENEDQIRDLQPKYDNISKLNARGIIVTAPGDQSDFVYRFFAPRVGVNEDPVTGSAHTTLIPYWSRRLRKNELSAHQLSKRKGILKCRNKNGKVVISGQAKLFLKGEICME